MSEQNSGAPAPGGQGGASTDTPWYSGIADEGLRGYVQVKGWQDMGQAVESYRNLEKLHGVGPDKLLRLPDKDDDAEGWGKVWDRLGRPAKPEDYKLPVPEGAGGEFAKTAAQWFHEAGVPAKQAVALAEKWNAWNGEQARAAHEKAEQQSAADIEALKREWAQGYDTQVTLGKRAAQEFGLDEEALTRIEGALGTSGMLKFFAKVGAKLSEHAIIDGGPGAATPAFKPTPEAARAKILELQSNQEWSKRYLGGDQQAFSEMKRLMALAYPEAA